MSAYIIPAVIPCINHWTNHVQISSNMFRTELNQWHNVLTLWVDAHNISTIRICLSCARIECTTTMIARIFRNLVGHIVDTSVHCTLLVLQSASVRSHSYDNG